MTEPAISVKNLSKVYKLGVINRHTLMEEVSFWLHKIRGKDPRELFSKVGHTATEVRKVEEEKKGSSMFSALENITFDVQPGEIVGIIGRNGAGKSTLLKLLTRITEPSSGDAYINGRVASLLEVGTGFHPELTGRENVYMNGTILGMKKQEITDKFDEIVAFSELEQFIDTPVKRYSSGMYVRLAFAVAAHLETEIILVDEVLAVGDVTFQKKCLGKMKDVAGAGRTVLFVSHNMHAVMNLCSRAILIDHGKLAYDSDPETVIAKYLDRDLLEGAVATEKEIAERVHRTSKNHYSYFRISEVRLEDEKGESKCNFDSTEPIVVSICLECIRPVHDLRVVVGVADEQGNTVFGSQNTDDCENAEMFYDVTPGKYKTKCTLPANVFSDRSYFINVSVLYPKKEQVSLMNLLEFKVNFKGYNPDIQYCGNNWGWFVWQKLPWNSEKMDETSNAE